MDLDQRLLKIIERAECARTYGKIAISVKDACIDDLIREARAALAYVRSEQPGERAEIFIKGAHAAMTQPATHQADVDVATGWLRQAQEFEQVRLWS